MSSRALRKLQKEQELERQLAAARAADTGEEAEDEEEDETESLPTSKPMNAFDMLEGMDEEEESEPEEGGEDQGVVLKHPDVRKEIEPVSTPSKSSKSKKKKKKSKKNAKEKASEEPAANTTGGETDEVDRALKELSMKDRSRKNDSTLSGDMEETDNHPTAATKLLGIDSKNLNPVNEMKSLFGNIALEGPAESRSSPRNPRRREQNQQGGVDLGTALTGQHSPASRHKSLGSLASRRNVFMQGKEEWPLAVSGGLSMERLESSAVEKKYAIVHNATYETAQREFRMLVEMMDPEKLIRMLIENPYHIATLLQVSEIAKHQGDHSVSGDLLERALFSFGRSVHSTFSVALREGTARISFEKPANRELYLTIWRYMKNLEMRGTWRTAFEWAKLLLQLDPRSDPYGITLMIDQLALRGRQNAAFIEMCSAEAYGLTWAHLPNIQISLALAYQRSSQPKFARQTLAVAMHKYPYVLSALASSLDIKPMPQSLWGKVPETDAEKLYTELYVTQAKDLWNTPETTSLLAEVAQTLDHYSSLIKSSSPAPNLEISLEEARHIMLLEIPQLIGLLPRRFTMMPTSSSDVLPPPNSYSDFTARAPMSSNGPGMMQVLGQITGAAGATVDGMARAVRTYMERFLGPAGPEDTVRDENGETGTEAAYRELSEAWPGVPADTIQEFLRQQMRAVEGDEDDDVGDGPLFVPQNMPGGFANFGDFDYYVERLNAPSDDDEDDDERDEGESMSDLESIPGGDGSSIPDLESIPDESMIMNIVAENSFRTAAEAARHPNAATVEEDWEDSEAEPEQPATAGRDGPILRRVDSDSENDDSLDFTRRHALPSAAPPRTNTQTNAEAQAVIHAMSAEDSPEDTMDSASAADSISATSDPQRIQRWLLSTGLTELQSKPETLGAYVENLKMLPRRQQQDWIVSMVKQRAGAELAQGISARLGR